MKARRTLTLCLAVFLLIGCIDTADLNRVFTAPRNPTLVAIMFYDDTSRWPTSRDELADYAARHPDLHFTNSLYATLTLDPGTNGSLDIRGTLAPPLKGEWTEHLGKPTNSLTTAPAASTPP